MVVPPVSVPRGQRDQPHLQVAVESSSAHCRWAGARVEQRGEGGVRGEQPGGAQQLDRGEAVDAGGAEAAAVVRGSWGLLRSVRVCGRRVRIRGHRALAVRKRSMWRREWPIEGGCCSHGGCPPGAAPRAVPSAGLAGGSGPAATARGEDARDVRAPRHSRCHGEHAGNQTTSGGRCSTPETSIVSRSKTGALQGVSAQGKHLVNKA